MLVLAPTCLTLGLILAALTRSLKSPSLPVTVEWIGELSVERYRPMLRLLNQEDLDFLRSHPGFTRKAAARFRAGRRRIFRGYLRSLKSDFKRICAALKILIVQSQVDRPDLTSLLVNSQATFAFGIIRVEFQLLLYRWGVGTVDVSSLLKPFDVMRFELRRLVPAEVPFGA